MINVEEFEIIISQLETERGISRDEVIGAIVDSVTSAAQKKFGMESHDNLRAVFAGQEEGVLGELVVLADKAVVAKVTDDNKEISKTDAAKIFKNAKVGSVIAVDVTPKDFGRIAAQAAKQVIIQRIREAEKRSITDEFESRIGKILLGTVQRVEGKNYLINLGRTEATLDLWNQIPGETFMPKDRVRVLLVEIDKAGNSPQLIISRSHERFIAKLFEAEVPEMEAGIIEIVNISRKAGERTKMFVKSNDASVGVVGTCVGRMGARIQAVLNEVHGEKIDVIEYSQNPLVMISNAMKPAKIALVEIVDAKNKIANVYIEDDQLALAIGKGGVNIRLATKLTGWRIEVVKKSEMSMEQFAEVKNKVEKTGDVTQGTLASKMMASAKDTNQAIVIEKQVSNDDDHKVETMKVADIAEFLSLTPKEVIEKLKKLGVEVKTKASSVSTEYLEQLK